MHPLDVLILPWSRRPMSRGLRVASIILALVYIGAFVAAMAVLGPRGDAWWVAAAALFLALGFAAGRRAARKEFERHSHTTATKSPDIS